MAMKTAGALLLSILVLALAACSSDSGDAVAVNPNIYPTDYKSEIIATLRPMFFEHQTATISGAEISPPALTAIDKDQRYSLCVRYTEHAAGTGNINTGIRRICYRKPYKLGQIEEMVRISGVELRQVDPKEVPAG